MDDSINNCLFQSLTIVITACLIAFVNNVYSYPIQLSGNINSWLIARDDGDAGRWLFFQNYQFSHDDCCCRMPYTLLIYHYQTLASPAVPVDMDMGDGLRYSTAPAATSSCCFEDSENGSVRGSSVNYNLGAGAAAGTGAGAAVSLLPGSSAHLPAHRFRFKFKFKF